MTDMKRHKLKLLSHVTQIYGDHWATRQNRKGFVFIFAANQGKRPIFEFQVQQEALIRFQRNLVEICAHKYQSGAASFDH